MSKKHNTKHRRGRSTYPTREGEYGHGPQTQHKLSDGKMSGPNGTVRRG